MSMSNEEAIFVLQEALNDIEPLSYGTSKLTQIALRKEAMRTAITALRNQQEWIPCEERLPEKEGAYLVFKKGIGRDGEPFTEIVETYFEKLWGWITKYEVVAWMPLPPAYKGGKTMDDYISREAAKKEIVEFWEAMPELRHCKENQLKRINSVPTADVRPVVRGRWIFTPNRGYVCSECNESVGYDKRSMFCPHCGTQMDGGAAK